MPNWFKFGFNLGASAWESGTTLSGPGWFLVRVSTFEKDGATYERDASRQRILARLE